MRERRRLHAALLAVSAAIHVLVLSALALSRGSTPQIPPPPPILQVQIAPAFLPPPKAAPRPKPLERPKPRAPKIRPARRPDEPAPVAPLLIPSPAPAAAAAPAALDEAVRNALRNGAPGCADAKALRLDKRAQDRCLERLGAGAKDAPFFPAPLSKEKQAAFDEAAEAKANCRKYRQGMPPGLEPSDSGIPGLGYVPKLRHGAC
ncbi:hypothetical protein [Phenylobacterium sp.]|uniref:hypothetical protein n=1 Tax=Phenylobacterium sp. TaxID=1871053 RepID=UPI0035B2818F